jgi:hypothetical protein
MKKWKSNHSNISLSKGSEMVPPLPPTPWALRPRGDDEIRDVLEKVCVLLSGETSNLADLAK